MSRETNMTVGRPTKLILGLAVPLILTNVGQQLYTVADASIVGRGVGVEALAALGATDWLYWLVLWTVQAMTQGFSVLVSQTFGSNDKKGLRKAITMSVLLCAAVGILLTVVFVSSAGWLLHLLDTPENIYDGAHISLTMMYAGTLITMAYNMAAAILRALGDGKSPLIAMFTAGCLNIVLDLLFVIRFGMGVAGVAWATLIAQGLCAVASLLVLLRRMRRMPCEPEKQGVKLPLFHMVAVKRIAQIGLPSMLQQSLVSLSMMMMQGLVNSFGKVLVAGYTAATKIDSLAMLPNMNISNAMSSFTAQNIGAGKYERVKEGLKACLLMVAVFSLLITVIIFLFGNQLLSLFLDPGDASGAMGYGLAYMHTVSLFYILMGLLFVPNGMLRGAGDMAAFTFSSMANLFSRVGIAYALVYLTPLGANAIWWSIPAGWLIGAAVSLLRVKSGKWMRKAVADR